MSGFQAQFVRSDVEKSDLPDTTSLLRQDSRIQSEKRWLSVRNSDGGRSVHGVNRLALELLSLLYWGRVPTKIVLHNVARRHPTPPVIHLKHQTK